MAANFCKVELMGTLTGAPSMRRNPFGEDICVLPLSVVQQVVTSFGRVVDETLNVDVEVSQRLAPVVMNGLTPGQMLMVEGRLRQYPLQPRGRMTLVLAESIQIIGSEGLPQAEYPQGEVLNADMLEGMQTPDEGEQMPF